MSPTSAQYDGEAGEKGLRIRHRHADTCYEIGVPSKEKADSRRETEICKIVATSQILVQICRQVRSKIANGGIFVGSECITCCEIEIEHFIRSLVRVGGEIHANAAAQLPVIGQVLPNCNTRGLNIVFPFPVLVSPIGVRIAKVQIQIEFQSHPTSAGA